MKVKTIMTDKIPGDINMAVRTRGNDFEVYVNPKRAYTSLRYRKEITGSVNKTLEILLHTFMEKIFLVNKKGTYKNYVGLDVNEKVNISKGIRNKINIFKKELFFSNELKAGHFYSRLNELTLKMEAMVDEILEVKSAEENEAGRKKGIS